MEPYEMLVFNTKFDDLKTNLPLLVTEMDCTRVEEGSFFRNEFVVKTMMAENDHQNIYKFHVSRNAAYLVP